MSKFWGYNLLLDCAECNYNIYNKDMISTFAKILVKEIDMVAYGEPIVEFMLKGDPKQGYSLVQLITTSSITGHFMDFDRTAYIDIFSCKEFDVDIAEKVVKSFFEPKRMRRNFITRDAG